MSKVSNKTQGSKSPVSADIKKTETDQQFLPDPATLQRNKWILLGLFVAFLSGFIVLYLNMPAITQKDKDILFAKIPRKGEDVKAIHEVVSRYYQQNSLYVYSLFCYLYIFLQSFGIPGPIILSLLSGALFGGIPGFITVCFCATLGASCCYSLSNLLGKGLVIKFFPDLMKKFNGMVSKQKGNLFWYMLFLRLTPLVPNWFVNMASPIVGIPLKIFFLGTFIGLMPANIIHVKTGLTISEVSEIGLNFHAILGLLVLGFVALIPTLLKKKLEKKLE